MGNFRMKKMPTKPKREYELRRIDLYDFSNVAELIKHLKELELNLKDVHIRTVWDETYLVANMLETDEDYQKRLDKYDKDLKKYNEWKKKNKDRIEEYKALEKEKQEIAKQLKGIDSKLSQI